MRVPVFASLCFVLSGFLVGGGHANASPEPAPSGWSDTTDGQVRVVTNGTSRVEIGDWQDLDGQSLDAWLGSMEHNVPADSKLLSSDGVQSERVKGAYSVGRDIERDGKQRFSLLYACPGLDGVGRLITLDVPMFNASELMAGGFFSERVCKNEPKRAADAVAVSQAEIEVAASESLGAASASED